MMKKNITKKITLFIVFIFLCSCGDDFLETEPQGDLTEEQIKEAVAVKPDVNDGNLTGLYTLMYATETGGITNGQEDFGQKGYDIITDILSADMVWNNQYSRYLRINNHTAMKDFTLSVPHYMVWRYYYRVIRAANTIIDSIGGNDVIPENEKNKHILAQAKAVRAYAYFYLANYLDTEYQPTNPILPIYTDAIEITANSKSLTSAVYDLIYKDLDSSISLLEGFERENVQFVDKTVAQGLKAYTAAAKGDYNEVLALTKDIITNGGYTMNDRISSLGGFNDYTTKSWMWGSDLTTNIGLNLVSFWGKIDIYTFSYASFGEYLRIAPELYDKIKDADIRKQQFNSEESQLGKDFPLYIPYKKFYQKDRKYRGERRVTSDYVYMRIEEMYILKAEAEAKLGQESEAKTTIKELLANRFEKTEDYDYVDGLSGDALKEEIYLQSDIELWGEGKKYLNMKRNKRTVTYSNEHIVTAFKGKMFPYNEPNLTFLIPQSELRNNPNITEGNRN